MARISWSYLKIYIYTIIKTPKIEESFPKFGGISAFIDHKSFFPTFIVALHFNNLIIFLSIVYWMLNNAMNTSKVTYLLESDIHAINILFQI